MVDMVDVKSLNLEGMIGDVEIKVGEIKSVPLQEALPLYARGRIEILGITKKVIRTEKNAGS